MVPSSKNNNKPDALSGKTAKKKITKKAISPKKVVFHADTQQTDFLIKVSKLVSDQAIREANALGLEIMYIDNGILYREKEGKRIAVCKIEDPEPTKYKSLKKGVTLYVKK